MNYVNFMRRLDGKPPKVEPKVEPEVDTSGFSYTGSMPVSPAHICAALSGGYTSIQHAFTWSGTSIPDVWYETIFCGAEPTPIQEAYLEWLLEEYS
jgi:hypothetical protein